MITSAMEDGGELPDGPRRLWLTARKAYECGNFESAYALCGELLESWPQFERARELRAFCARCVRRPRRRGRRIR